MKDEHDMVSLLLKNVVDCSSIHKIIESGLRDGTFWIFKGYHSM
jgi:hypothetical protein